MRCPVATAALFGGVLAVAGCGLRSNVLDGFEPPDDDGLSEDTDFETQEGSCAMPKSIPADVRTFTLQGYLSGSGSEVGPCGRDEGPEGVYAYSPPSETDVTIRAIASDSSFVPTIRVEHGGCGSRGLAELCASDFLRSEGSGLVAGLERHFFAQPRTTYYITVDSPAGTSGHYAIELQAGPPALAQCNVHSEQIVQAPGSTFAWLNEFGAGYGRVSSRCGAPGRENMFKLRVDRPGWMFVGADGTGGFIPVLSLRTDCSATTEIDCATTGSREAFAQWFVDPGEYWLTVDNASTDAGGYELFVLFE